MSWVSRLVGICTSFEGDDSNFLERLDANIREEFGDPSPGKTAREHVSDIIKSFFEQKIMITQYQILHGS